jgi:hypothetical protein
MWWLFFSYLSTVVVFDKFGGFAKSQKIIVTVESFPSPITFVFTLLGRVEFEINVAKHAIGSGGICRGVT